jgi:predicted AlkP superfamily pyrophosphatase or phosphodiesterase
LSFESWLKTEDNYFDGPVTETTVDGAIAYKIESTDSFDGSEDVFTMVEHNGKIYELNFNVPSADDYMEEREHMLDSFQFLSSTNETSSNSSSCDEEVCFVENFKTCESATMSADMGFGAVSYEILGATSKGCEVQMVYTKNPNPAWVDQPIVCTLDMDADFLPAWQKEFEAAVEGEGNCTGPLTEILKDL